MNISTSYDFISNANLSLKSGRLTDAKLPVQNDIAPIPDVNSAIGRSISTPSTIEASIYKQSTYSKPSLDNSHASPKNTQTISPSIEVSGKAENIDDAIEGEEQSKTNPLEPQSSSPTAQQSQHNEQPHSEYSEEELALIDSLQLRDTEVETHERAHAAVGGQHAGSPSYSYKTGPDGVKYAVSGEVSIDTSRVAGDPQATLQKAKQIKAAALAPAEPSSQDRKVAAKADQMATQARNEILAENANDSSTKDAGGNRPKNVSQSNYDTNVPEHFSGQESLSSNTMQVNEMGYLMDNETQVQMQDRNLHINEVYQNSTKILASSHLNIQA